MRKIVHPIILLLLISFICCRDKKADDGFTAVFDGQTLSGWRGDTAFWRAENGVLIGEITPQNALTSNTFLIFDGETPQDFELELEYRISANGNSGINYRSQEVPGIPFALKGYQFDMDGHNNYTGQNYEERGRTTLAYQGQTVVLNALSDSLANHPVSDLIQNNAWTATEIIEEGNVSELKSHLKPGDWNACRLIVNGNHMKHFVNGVLMSDVTDNDPVHGKTDGLIGLQLHVGPPMKVEFRNIRLKSK